MGLKEFCISESISMDELKLMSIVNFATARRCADDENIEYVIGIKLPNFIDKWKGIMGNLIAKSYIYYESKGGKIIYLFTDKSSKIISYCNENRLITRFFYDNFYRMSQESKVHGEFCKKVYGRNFNQHGMADMNQINELISLSNIKSDSNVLEVGCGSGYITEYINEVTGANITGIDLSEEAIDLARERTRYKEPSLRFIAMNMENINFHEETFNYIVAIDSLFFARDVQSLVDKLMKLLTPCGRILAFMIHDPQIEVPTLERYLIDNNIKYSIRDFSKENYKHWTLKKDALLSLKETFEEEGSSFLYNNRMAECTGEVLLRDCKRKLYIIEK